VASVTRFSCTSIGTKKEKGRRGHSNLAAFSCSFNQYPYGEDPLLLVMLKLADNSAEIRVGGRRVSFGGCKANFVMKPHSASGIVVDFYTAAR